MTIGEFIKLKREAANMSQAELYKALPTQRDKSQLTHGGRPTISKIESNQQSLTLEQFISLAQALGYEAWELLKEFETWNLKTKTAL